MIPCYDQKVIYLYRHQHGQCTICGDTMGISSQMHSLDHRLHNKRWTRKKFPLFLNSLLNLHLVHNSCNIDKRKNNRNTEKYAIVCERHLEKNELSRKFVTEVR